MIELLQAGKQQGWERLRQAIEQAQALGCTDAAAVRHLLSAEELARAPVELEASGDWSRYARPLPGMKEYDLLLASPTEVAP
jgi:hypothetical protein